MLTNLHVRNLALIEEENIDFDEGLNILTGETGAGKSIILGSINAALGSKTSPDFIRSGSEYGLAEVSFFVNNDEKINKLKEIGIDEIEDGEVLISRKIMPNRSQIKVNGQSFTASLTKEVANQLIDIHGQHDNQMLTDEEQHLLLLDKYAKEVNFDLLSSLKTAYKEYQQAKKSLEELSGDDELRQREISFLEFEINEIESAKLFVGEDEQVENDYRRLNNYQKIASELSMASQIISEGNTNISDMSNGALKALISASEYDSDLSEISDMMSDADGLISEIRHLLNSYMDNMNFDQAEFIRLENRLDLINSLKMKYGNSIESILKNLEDKKIKLDEYNNYDELLNKRKKACEIAYNKAMEISRDLSKVRKNVAKDLEKAVIDNLVDLNFLEVRFEIEFSDKESFSSNGIDNIRFLISTNPGEELKPLSKIASGGELSRIMLAIKSVMADKEEGQTLIFDEIDAGISGKTAQKVAVKLKDLAKKHQIICITHLPQIAAKADSHYIIEKVAKENRTVSSISKLSYDGSINELARMLGGELITQAVLLNAKELKEQN